MRWAPAAILVIVAIGALKLASDLVLPIVISIMLTMLLQPLLGWLRGRRIPEPVGAALLVFGSVALFVTATYQLSGPAAKWIEQAPRSLTNVERKLRRVSGKLDALKETAEKVEEVTGAAARDDAPVVQVAQPPLAQRLGNGGIGAIGGALSVMFLTYFLLAATPLFRRKLAMVIPGRADRGSIERLLLTIEGHMSRYLWLSVVINSVVGLLTWGLLALLEFPNAMLWGAAAGILNFAPYVGALLTVSAIALVGIATFDTFTPAIWGVLGFTVINLIESNLLTPSLMGKKLPVNAAAVFLGLMFFGWLWGFTGAVLAVPLTVMVQVVTASIPATHSISVFLDN